jgi:hypothetical protein
MKRLWRIDSLLGRILRKNLRGMDGKHINLPKARPLEVKSGYFGLKPSE